jgi:hypothetical protein
MPPTKTPYGDVVKVPTQYWEAIAKGNLEAVCQNALAKRYPPTGLILAFLTDDLLVDIERRVLWRMSHGGREPVDDPLLTLLCLVYLLNANPDPLRHEMVSVHELKSAHFFQGPHELDVQPLVERYGDDLDQFKRTAESWGGVALDFADVAFKILTFPKVPMYYLLWEGDREFKASLSILFDRSVEYYLPPDAIWGLANLVSRILLMGNRRLDGRDFRPSHYRDDW